MKAEIVTYTGKLFDIYNPKPESVCIEDIAHSLANQCRFTGHVRKYYSVAEHSVRMATSAELVGDPLTLLLHDAAEAYIGDLASPFKKTIWLPDGKVFQSVKVVEDKILAVIGEALGVDLKLGPEIKLADCRMGATEVRDLMPASSAWDMWYEKFEPLKEKIVPWTPYYAVIEFLMAYNDFADDDRKLLHIEEYKL